MPELPAAYLRDAALFQSITDKILKCEKDRDNIVPIARDLATRIRAFLTRWQNQPAVAAHDGLLANFRSQLLSTERHIEALHVATLAELLEYCKCRIEAHNLLEAILRLADIIRCAAPEELVEIRRQLTQSGHENFEPDSAIAAQTAETARQDADCERLIDEYERFWPDRLDDLHYLAILDLKLDQHASLAEELHLMKSTLA